MEISREAVQPLVDALSGDDGFCIQLGHHTDAAASYHLQGLLRKLLPETLEPETLYVDFEDARWKIVGTEDIERFCESGFAISLKKLRVSKRVPLTMSLPFYSQECVLSGEKEEGIEEGEKGSVPVDVVYRVVKRGVYTMNENLRVVIESVKEAVGFTALSADIKFCVSLDVGPKNDLKGVLTALVQMVRLMERTPVVALPSGMAKEVCGEYMDSVRKATKVDNAPMYFFAPKPITLEQKHLRDPGYGVLTVTEGYAVTEKADGERLLMYIAEDGEAYLINNTMQVFRTGYKVKEKKHARSLLDGEFVTWDRRKPVGAEKDLFAFFDAYIHHDKDLMGKGLMQRMEVVKEIFENMEAVGSPIVDLRIKEHLTGENIFEVCKGLLEKDHPYHVDGLIFTPLDIPVFAYYSNQKAKFEKIFYRSARWDRLLKWKPSDQNTIDFLVKNEVTMKDSKIFTLFNGQRKGRYTMKTITENLRALAGKREKVKEVYEETPFRTIEHYYPGMEMAKIPLNVDGKAVDGMGLPIEENMIVEFAYDIGSKTWQPLRVRDDKTRMYRATGKIGGSANDYEVARNIWRSMHNPVTVEMITGRTKIQDEKVRTEVEEALSQDGVYYAREVPREYSLSLQMLEFHNLVIKASLYNNTPKRRRLLELACGKAGDWRRWEEMRFNTVVGIDISRDNIVNPEDGAYARVMAPRKYPYNKNPVPTYAFLVGDVGKPLAGADTFDKESESIWKVITGKQKPATADVEGLYNIGRNGFDVVSCQFAIHYFCKDEKSLETFLANVAGNLVKGGQFVGTCMDGKLVDELCAEKRLAEGRKEGVAMWAIQRQYERPMPTAYGNKVDIYLEMTQQVIPEYLVMFENLVEMAGKFGLRLKASELFKTTLVNCLENNKWPVRITDSIRQSAKELAEDPVLLQFSGLNRWFIFEKQ